MPASSISQLSINYGNQRSELAASFARDIAKEKIKLRLKAGTLKRDGIEKAYKEVYLYHYYDYYKRLSQQEPSRIIILENPANHKFPGKHTVFKFSKSNYLIHAHSNHITVGRFKYPIDNSLDTKEAFLTEWPGPLDRPDNQSKRKIEKYTGTLLHHDSERKIRYCIASNDVYRSTILRFLRKLLRGSGTFEAPDVTRLLLTAEEIQKDESNRKPLDTLQEYLLLGDRDRAYKYAMERNLWGHTYCLTFVNQYQLPRTGPIPPRDPPTVQVTEKFIGTVDHGILNLVYRSLFNRVLQSDPYSVSIIKHPNVKNNHYEFAMLSANDCEMEFDPKNELFKLIMAAKHVASNPVEASNHLISLGHTSIADPFNDSSDDLSYQSHVSFKQGETYASRALTISNTDMLILNEIWEYCLNLAKGTCDSTNYEYILGLVPYKLVFASRLLDYGLHSMFAEYLDSIKNALMKAKSSRFVRKDPFYDWDAIEMSVEYLSGIWDLYLNCPHESFHQLQTTASSPEFLPIPSHHADFGYSPPTDFNPVNPSGLVHSEMPADYTDSSMQPNSIGQSFSFPLSPINDHDDIPRRESDVNYSPELPPIPSHHADFGYSPPTDFNTVNSSPSGLAQSELHADYTDSSMQPNSMIGHSYSSPLSPIHDHDDLPRRESDVNSRTSAGTSHTVKNDQQSGFFTHLVGSAKALLPKSNSKQMILPDDSSKAIVYDDKRGTWIDTTEHEGNAGNNVADAPPVMNLNQTPSYSFAKASSKTRYPKAQF